jgi:hypothetical protein
MEGPMPVSTDNARISMDFNYEWEAPDGEITLFPMKFLHTEFGPRIMIFDGELEPIDLPASMFTEVAEFLIRQGVLKGSMQAFAVPTISNKPLLAVPSIARKPRVEAPPAPPVISRSTRTAATTEPVTSLSPRPDPDEIEETEPQAVAKPVSAEDMSTTEAERLMERARAAAAQASKRIRSKPKLATEETNG